MTDATLTVTLLAMLIAIPAGTIIAQPFAIAFGSWLARREHRALQRIRREDEAEYKRMALEMLREQHPQLHELIAAIEEHGVEGGYAHLRRQREAEARKNEIERQLRAIRTRHPTPLLDPSAFGFARDCALFGTPEPWAVELSVTAGHRRAISRMRFETLEDYPDQAAPLIEAEYRGLERSMLARIMGGLP